MNPKNNCHTALHNNKRSFNKNFGEFKTNIIKIKYKIDVMILKETWKIINVNLFNMPNYCAVYSENVLKKIMELLYILNHIFNSSVTV